MTDLREAAADLMTTVQFAIKSGDWRVDGACDPTLDIERLRQALAHEALDRMVAENQRLGLYDDKPPVKNYCGGKANYCTPEVTGEVTREVPCKTDPRAPHGFNRNASFDEDRYVCDCEFWEPPEETFILDRGCYERGCVAYDERDGDGVYMSEKRVHKTDKSIHEPLCYLRDDIDRPFGGFEHCDKDDPGAFPVYLAPPKRDSSSWVGLTDDEIVDLAFSVDSYKGLVQATEAKLKEKNGG